MVGPNLCDQCRQFLRTIALGAMGIIATYNARIGQPTKMTIHVLRDFVNRINYLTRFNFFRFLRFIAKQAVAIAS